MLVVGRQNKDVVGRRPERINDYPIFFRPATTITRRSINFHAYQCHTMLRTMTNAMNPLSSANPVSSRIFQSLASDRRPWTLTRTLKSENPADLRGELKGVASFRAKRPETKSPCATDMLYTEEGEMPVSGNMAGVRWTKKYIWRFTPSKEGSVNGRRIQGEAGSVGEGEVDHGLSVWFVKPTTEDEPDYLFHELPFDISTDSPASPHQVLPPVVPDKTSKVYVTRGEHLCVKDMYNTTYAFRVDEFGEVLSWASRHVVEGPTKNQDIVNLYSRS